MGYFISFPNRSWSLTYLEIHQCLVRKYFQNNNWVVKGETETLGVVMVMFILPERSSMQSRKHSPIVALGLVLSPSMLGPSSGSGSHGQEMITYKSTDNELHAFWCVMQYTHECWSLNSSDCSAPVEGLRLHSDLLGTGTPCSNCWQAAGR